MYTHTPLLLLSPLTHFCGAFLTVFTLCHFFMPLGSSLIPVEGT